MQQGGWGRPDVGERTEGRKERREKRLQRKEEEREVSVVNGAKYYRQGRALKLKGHFWVNHVLKFQGRNVAGDKEKKVRLGIIIGMMEALVR